MNLNIKINSCLIFNLFFEGTSTYPDLTFDILMFLLLWSLIIVIEHLPLHNLILHSDYECLSLIFAMF